MPNPDTTSDQPIRTANDGHVHVPADLFAPSMKCRECGTTLDPLTRQPLYDTGGEVALS
jgi:hypothetical protein